MNDSDIKSQRASLLEREQKIVLAWTMYDAAHPGINFLKPLNYEEMQRDFHNQLIDVRGQLRILPKTTVEKIRPIVLALSFILALWFMARFFF